MIFSYKAFDKTNALKTGTIDVADKFEAKKALASQGLKIVSLKQNSANTLSPEKITKGEKGGGENSYTTYFFMVQDNTAGIVVSLGTKAMENIKIGDSITGLRGVFSNMRGMTTNILDVDEVLREEIKVQSSAK